MSPTLFGTVTLTGSLPHSPHAARWQSVGEVLPHWQWRGRASGRSGRVGGCARISARSCASSIATVISRVRAGSPCKQSTGRPHGSPACGGLQRPPMGEGQFFAGNACEQPGPPRWSCEIAGGPGQCPGASPRVRHIPHSTAHVSIIAPNVPRPVAIVRHLQGMPLNGH
jgi:hypothetical protein